MLRLYLLVILLTHSIRTAHVTDSPTVIDRLYQKLEKLDRLNSLAPEHDTDEYELMSAMHAWLSAEQMDGVMKDLQRAKAERQDSDQDYGDSDWNDEDPYPADDYHMDGNDGIYYLMNKDTNDDWDNDEVDSSPGTKHSLQGITPSAITKLEPVSNVVSAAASIAATNARPRIIQNPMLPSERRQLHSAVLRSTGALLRTGKCLVPQPRWLTVRQLAPAADTVYTPPCVQLHRCAPDSGCCTNEGDVCAPVEGKTVIFPFYLHKADSTMDIVRMQFYNHTQCACVSRDSLQRAISTRLTMAMTAGNPSYSSESQEDERPPRPEMERQNDWRMPTEEPSLDKDEEATAPPQLRRCTCPALFMASMNDTAPCSCVCEWPDSGRRQECRSLARGKEHFGLRDRVCVVRGDCTPPTCEYGAYDRTAGRCPQRRYRRVRYHNRGRYQEKTYTV